MKHITAFENVQRRVTKLIPGFKDIKDCKERLQRLPTLAYRRFRGDMIELYKILTGKYDVSVSSSLITLRNNDSDTRARILIIMDYYTSYV